MELQAKHRLLAAPIRKPVSREAKTGTQYQYVSMAYPGRTEHWIDPRTLKVYDPKGKEHVGHGPFSPRGRLAVAYMATTGERYPSTKNFTDSDLHEAIARALAEHGN